MKTGSLILCRRETSLLLRVNRSQCLCTVTSRLGIVTCELNKANPFHYLTELQKHSEQLKQRSSEWMPWNYRETLARLATPAARVI